MNYPIKPLDVAEENRTVLEQIIDVRRRLFPDNDRMTVDEWIYWTRAPDPAWLDQYFYVSLDERAVASLHLYQSRGAYKPGRYSLYIEVHPDYQRRGLGTQLYDFGLLKLAPRQPTELLSTTYENCAEALAFLHNRGFEPVMREPISALDLTAFDPAAFAETAARVAGAAIEIRQLSEGQARVADWPRKLYALWHAVLSDIPSSGERKLDAFERWQARVLDAPHFDPSLWFVAIDGANGQFVGLSTFYTGEPGSDTIGTGLAGVVRSHRRRGIVTALKVYALSCMQKLGFQRTTTGNEENNPMYQINLRLGYEPLPARLSLVKTLDEARGE